MVIQVRSGDYKGQIRRFPTISLDHCFMGTAEDEKTAHESPVLVLYDSDIEALYVIAVPSKECTPWIVAWVKAVIDQFGYGGIKIGMKMNGARELLQLRREVIALRSAPTVPIDVMKKESKNNGAAGKAVQTWEWQFRTFTSHIEFELDEAIPKDHPVLQWCTWWAAQVVNRAAVKHNGRTVYEYITGHQTKAPLVCFGETVYWREKRTADALNKYDSEISEEYV